MSMAAHTITDLPSDSGAPAAAGPALHEVVTGRPVERRPLASAELRRRVTGSPTRQGGLLERGEPGLTTREPVHPPAGV
jgi:hypothetical protein